MNIIETNLDFSNLSKRGATNRIILHHTGVAVEQSVEVIHNYHKNSLGYAGIGYHFYIRKNGEIYRGRPEDTVGAHAYSSNNDSIGICFEGNFEEEQMTEGQIKSGKELVNYLKEKYNINKVQMHRDVNQTSCPGKNFKFDEIVAEIKNEPVEETKSIDELAQEVIDGKWDVYPKRKELLESAGYDFNAVQNRVNEIINGNKKSNEEVAKEVIRGDWGNGAERKNRLEAAGYDYNEVQKIVNNMMK